MSEQTEREAFERWCNAQPDGRMQPWDVWRAAQAAAIAQGHACVFALDNAGGLYRRYSSPQCSLAASAAVQAAPAPLSREVMEAAAVALEEKAWMDGLCVDPQADEDAATIRAALAAPPDTYSTMLEALRTALQAFREIRHARTSPNWFTHGERGATMQRLMWEQRGLDAVQSAIGKASAPAAPTEPAQRPL